MSLTNSYLVALPWIAWAIYWYVASRGTKAVTYRESGASRALHIVPLVIAFILLAAPSFPLPWLNMRFVPWTTWPFWFGVALTAAGLLFTVWARVHLAANWSGTVTIKRGHELITSGPYCIVRNPMYTGLLFAIVGTAVWRGDLQGVLAVVVALASLWRKLRVEERVLQEQFGQSYAAYRRRVRALIPYVV